MIELNNITVEKNNTEVLQKINCKFRDNKISIIMGPSGAGKSSILKVIMGIWKPAEGKVFIDNVEISTLAIKKSNNIKHKIGVVFQTNALFDSMNVEQNVGYFLREKQLSTEDEINKRVNQCLDIVNLLSKKKLFPENLSEGMKKRVAIARAISYEPDILLYDEPTTGLDPVNSNIVLDLICEMNKAGKTTIVVTHLIHDALKIGDYFFFVSEGTLFEIGTKEDLLKSDNPKIQEFLN